MNQLDPPPLPETPEQSETRQLQEATAFSETVAKLWNLQPLKPFLDTQCIRAEDANEVELALIGRWSHRREETKQEPVSEQEFLAMIDKGGFERYSHWRSDTHKRRGLRLRKRPSYPHLRRGTVSRVMPVAPTIPPRSREQ
jgi:hypothetical protein